MMGLLKAKELLLTGRLVDVDEVLKLGLLTEISDDPKVRALELARQLSELPSVSLASSKTALETTLFHNMKSCLKDEVEVASHCFAQSDAALGYPNFAARKATTARLGHDTKDVAKGNIRDLSTALSSSFDTAAVALAGGLRKVDIAPGDRALAMMENSVEMAYSWMAVDRLGGIWVPINPELKSVTLKGVITSAQPKLAIVDEALLPELHRLTWLIIFFSDVLYCPFPLFHLDATALAIIPALLLGAVAVLSVRFSASKFWDEIRITEATVYNYMGATLAITYKQQPNERDRDHNVRPAWGIPLPSFVQEY
ncbi:long-chain-fatty-acid ligase [Fusarium pseudocircinatum]|uniref:Long-chain-fatty-acid ligase n=1 Tax=Fusarium pseudocircinatum TaxID=56676 RepID=A0A8H5KRY2_9HYPO|nr:long-chain-fatty-acid ligase [Fusarium pseudocircinatum]